MKADAKGRVSGGVSQEQFVSFVRCLDPGAEEEEEEEGGGAICGECRVGWHRNGWWRRGRGR